MQIESLCTVLAEATPLAQRNALDILAALFPLHLVFAPVTAPMSPTSPQADLPYAPNAPYAQSAYATAAHIGTIIPPGQAGPATSTAPIVPTAPTGPPCVSAVTAPTFVSAGTAPTGYPAGPTGPVVATTATSQVLGASVRAQPVAANAASTAPNTPEPRGRPCLSAEAHTSAPSTPVASSTSTSVACSGSPVPQGALMTGAVGAQMSAMGAPVCGASRGVSAVSAFRGDMPALATAVLHVLLRRDNALNRRLYAWLLGLGITLHS